MSRVRVRGWWLVSLLALAVMAMPWPAWLVEVVYSRRIYPLVQRAMTGASNQMGWAIIDVLLVAAAVYVLWRLVRAFTRSRERGIVSGVWELTRRLLRTSALLGLAFLAVWGLNYRRVPLETTLRGATSATTAISAADIRALADAAVAGTRLTRPADDSGGDRSYASVAARLAGPFQQALQRLGMPAVTTGRPKSSVVLTPFFTSAGVTGMVNPLVLESIVHPDLLPFERPMVLAHEWAHLAGFADEADASAVGWLACTLGDPDLAYSAHVFVVIETAGAMPRPVWRDLRAQLDPGVIRDLDALTARLTKQQPVVRDTAFKVYDGYLRSNRVADGVQSYSRVLRVLTALTRGTG
jgi:hypothetical protein